MEWFKLIVLVLVAVFFIWIAYQFIMTIYTFRMWKRQQAYLEKNIQDLFKEEK